jgi:hypothetical protein
MKANQERAPLRAKPFVASSHWRSAAIAILFLSPLLQGQTSATPKTFSSLRALAAGFCDPETHECPAQNGNASPAGDFQEPASNAASHSQDTWVNRWLRMVDKTRVEQPHYASPLITTHVLLVQQFRFDAFYQTDASGFRTNEYGGSKGLEIIQNPRLEVQVGIPPYFFHESPNVRDGFGDVSMFLKFRAFSAPEGKGEYFVGFFLPASFPSGSAPNGLRHTVWSPMLAAAKGWGFFDVQSTLSGNLPQSGTSVLGRQILFNNAFQFKVAKVWWPVVETNSTFFVDGPNSGNQETFLTPGLVAGPFQIAERLHFLPGFGVQIAATHFHQYNHRWIWSARFPF